MLATRSNFELQLKFGSRLDFCMIGKRSALRRVSRCVESFYETYNHPGIGKREAKSQKGRDAPSTEPRLSHASTVRIPNSTVRDDRVKPHRR